MQIILIIVFNILCWISFIGGLILLSPLLVILQGVMIGMLFIHDKEIEITNQALIDTLAGE